MTIYRAIKPWQIHYPDPIRGAAGDRLEPLGVRPGDRVMLLAYNSPDWVLALWAVGSAGAVPVLGNRERASTASASAGAGGGGGG